MHMMNNAGKASEKAGSNAMIINDGEKLAKGEILDKLEFIIGDSSEVSNGTNSTDAYIKNGRIYGMGNLPTFQEQKDAINSSLSSDSSNNELSLLDSNPYKNTLSSQTEQFNILA